MRAVKTPVRSKRRIAVAVGLALVVAASYFVGRAVHDLDGQLARAEEVSITVVDRHDRLLRAFTTADDRWRLPVEPGDVDARYVAMLTAFEDKRFQSHPGVDPLAVGRAAQQFVRNGRIVSGASTLTMQTARLLDGEHPRSALGKVRQMVRAVALERRLDKTGILCLYLRLAPFGGNIEGVRAASLAYFGKEPKRLSIAEAALLVALPQAPKSRRPDRYGDAAHRARDRVLDRMQGAGVINAEEASDAKREPVPRARRAFPLLAPHVSEDEVRLDPRRTVHRLTLDRDVQARLETLAREQAQALGPKVSVALLAVDHRTGEILAHVGSADYHDASRLGAIDMTDAVRSPGSTLKPVIYGLAFEQGLAHPETLIEDQPTRFGTWAPKNFDEEFHGTVTIREALTQSLNIPAVKVLSAVGPARLVGRLRRIRLQATLPPGTEPTIAIALGGIGLRLVDLATLYATLARGGETIRLEHRRDAPRPRGRVDAAPRLLSPTAAWYVTDILKGAPPPANAKRGGFAYKTGTSYGYRDAWAIGYDGRVTVAVWVGRPDATATPGLTGRSAAAPILFDAMARLADRPTPFAGAPAGVVRAATGALPPPLRRFQDPGAADATTDGPWLEPAVAIAFPPDKSQIETTSSDPDQIILKAEGGALPLTWIIDGTPLETDPTRRDAQWQPAGRGFARISVIDAKGRTDRVEVRLK